MYGVVGVPDVDMALDCSAALSWMGAVDLQMSISERMTGAIKAKKKHTG